MTALLTSSKRCLARMALAGLALAALPSSSGAVVDPDAPVEGQAVSGALPPLAVSGALPEPPVPFSGPWWTHEGRLTLFPDLLAAPAVTGACPSLIPPPAGTTVSPALSGDLSAALGEASKTVSQLDGGTILDFFDVFQQAVEILGGDVQVNVGSTTNRCVGHPALHARWLRSQYKNVGLTLPWKGEKLHTYHGRPVPFQESRLRGARLYCAARRAQAAQGSAVPSMGEQVGFSAKVLGKQIDFLVVEPTLVLGGPERFTGEGANDGAQAFAVPLLAGTRITPIRGLGLPGFREVRVPVALVSADSEIRTASELRPVWMGSSVECSFSGGPPYGCAWVPQLETKHSKVHQTVTHAGAALSAQKQASLTGHTELFRVGPLAVRFEFALDYFLGTLETDPTRVLELPGAGLPPLRKGRLWVNPLTAQRHHDGPWGIRFFGPALSDLIPGTPYWTVLPDGETDPFWREPVRLFFPPPLEVRLLQNDDRALSSATGLSITGGLGGVLGKSFGPLEVTLKVVGSLTGQVAQRHLLRDGLFAQDQGGSRMMPVTGLSVRPQQTAEATLDPAKGTLNLFLGLPWPFDDIDITKTLFSVSKVTLAKYDSDDGLAPGHEVRNLRLGTGSAAGNVTEKPLVTSHLPGGGEFQSFPVDVDTCLADATPNLPTPPPCDPVLDPGEPPSAGLCLYGPGPILDLQLPPNVCQHLESFVSGLGHPPLQAECVADYLAFLCSPVSKQQPFGGLPSVVSHVLDLEDPSGGEKIASLIEACAGAFGEAASDGSIDPNPVAEDFLSFALCTADGTLLDGDDILGATGSPGTPPPVNPAAACH